MGEADLFGYEANGWVIFNSAGWRWGKETYSTEADARSALKTFWKGVSGVKLDRFYIREFSAVLAKTVEVLPELNRAPLPSPVMESRDG